MAHVVILPYFSQAEIDRYLKIVDLISRYPQPTHSFKFLLACSPRTTPNAELEKACNSVAPTYSFRCPTQIFGYPEGPSAMFWDAIDYINDKWGDEPGFSLWMESDMVPAHERWLDRLSEEWYSAESPALMGCYVPPVYKRRLFRRWKFMLDEHINGGACYAKNLAARLTAEAREGVFDMSVFPAARKVGDIIKTTQIAFSTVAMARRDIIDPQKVLLHGFMQDKDQFIERCVKPVTPHELRHAVFHPALNRFDHLRRTCRVWFFKFGCEAMFENMMLTKQKADNEQRAA